MMSESNGIFSALTAPKLCIRCRALSRPETYYAQCKPKRHSKYISILFCSELQSNRLNIYLAEVHPASMIETHEAVARDRSGHPLSNLRCPGWSAGKAAASITVNERARSAIPGFRL